MQGALIQPTGDFAADMAPAWAFFRRLTPRHPERVLFPDDYGMDGPDTAGAPEAVGAAGAAPGAAGEGRAQ